LAQPSMLRGLAVLLLVLACCTPMPPNTKQAISDWRSGKPDSECEIAGHSSQWQADYCLAAMETDDLVAAQPCLDHERRRHLGEECAARRHYKQDWCRLMVRNGASGQSFAECLADPQANGTIVKNGGLE
jgi:hypothetical protein